MAPFKAVAPRPKRSKLDYKPQRIKSPRRAAPPQTAKGSEHWHQSTFITILRGVNHSAAKWTFAVPNGFLKSKSSRLRAWKEGVISGVADLCTPFPSQGFHGLWLEFKVKPNTPTDEQLKFGLAMQQHGYKYAVVYGWQEALEVWCSYVGIRVDLRV